MENAVAKKHSHWPWVTAGLIIVALMLLGAILQYVANPQTITAAYTRAAAEKGYHSEDILLHMERVGQSAFFLMVVPLSLFILWLTTALTRRARVLPSAIFFLGLYFIIAFLYVALRRIGYPYELEWLEGLMAVHFKHIAAGGALYPPPNSVFCPLMYTPLYAYLGGALEKIGLQGFFAGRFISLISSLMTLALLWRIGLKETNDRFYAFVALSLYAAAYGAVGSFFDIARVDAFQVLLLLGAFYCWRYYPGGSGIYGAGVLLLAAFFTKQSAAIFLILFSIGLLIQQGFKKSLPPLLFIGVIGAGLSLGGSLKTDGWYWFYTYTTLSYYEPIHPKFFFRFLKDLPQFTVFFLLFAGWYFRRREIKKEEPEEKIPLEWLIALLAGTLTAFLTMTKRGAFANNYMTFFVFAAPVIAVILWRFSRRAPAWANNLTALALLTQLCLLFYNPLTLIPSYSDREAGDRLISFIRRMPGEVYLPNHVYYGMMAGKKMYVSNTSLQDMKGAGIEIPEDFQEKFKKKEFAAVITDQEEIWPYLNLRPDYPLKKEIEDNYVRQDDVIYPASHKMFFPAVGYPTRPNFVYLPKE